MGFVSSGAGGASYRAFDLRAAGVVVLALGLAACFSENPHLCTSRQIMGADNKCWSEYVVRLDSVGFIPDRVKLASYKGGSALFNVRKEDDGTVVFSDTSRAVHNADTDEDLAVADFSAVIEPGAYYVEVPDIGESPRFRIGVDVYNAAFRAAFLGLHGQRCGTAVSFRYDGADFSHGACHLHDALLTHATGENVVRDTLGGWHDAGDYGKYTVNGAFAVAFLLNAWAHFRPVMESLVLPIPEQGGTIPDLLDEARWQLAWLSTTQFPDGSATHKVTALDFEGMVAPVQDTQARYYAPTGTAATADLAAIMAMAARIYEPYDPAFSESCSAAAERSYAYLQTHLQDQPPDLSQFHTGGYTTRDADDRLWAAAEMWETTGSPDALADFEGRAANESILSEWDWSNLQNLGLFTYLLSARPGRNEQLVKKLESSAIAAADRIAASAEAHGYGRGLGGGYYWGINGTVARATLNLQVAHRIDPQTRYLDAAVQQLGHLFGRNYYGRSFVTGVGHYPAANPHHRPSVAAQKIWPGLLVGGPWPKAADWVDSASDYKTNEVAINWNAALLYALAGFVTPDGAPQGLRAPR
ncbi:MAG TPA: glycoside hydrolase family 9 protein [Polyangiaceae bacterium]|nr:glycoside hydrolase family 9 protein [Polyangiaceae bacterium]